MWNEPKWQMVRAHLWVQIAAAIFWLISEGSLAGGSFARQVRPKQENTASASAATTPGQPVWPGDVALTTAPGDQGIGTATGPGVAVVPDGSKGAIIVWEDDASANVKAQRVDSTGKPLWAAGGVAVAPSSGFEMSPRAVSDSAGSVIIAWVDGRTGICNPSNQFDCNIFAQRLDPSGNPLWAAGGVSITSAPANQGTSGIAIAPDGQGGAIFGWEDARNTCCTFFAQRINTAGVVQWTTDGVQVSPNPTIVIGPVGHAPGVVSDGAGGAYVVWLNEQVNPLTQLTNLSIQRLDAKGNILFAAGGIAVLNVIRGDIGLVDDGAGGAILAGVVKGADGFGDISAQRVDPTGKFLWGSQGVAIVAAPNSQQNSQMVSDGNGGAIAVWEDQRNNTMGTNCFSGPAPGCDIFAQRLNSSGAPLWLANGLPVSVGLNGQVLPRVVSDGGGGAVFAWQDCRNVSSFANCDFTRDLAAQRVSAAGTPMWPSNGILLTTASFNQGVDYGTEAVPSFAIATDATGGAILAWPDGRAIPCAITVGQRECDVYAQRVSDQVGAAPTADLSVQMSALPNPSPAGGNVTFTMTITNNGPNTAEGVNLLDAFPGLGRFVSMTPTQGGCIFSAGFVGPLCGLGPLASGSKATVTLVMGTAADNPGTYTNSATVYSGENDPNTANNTGSASVNVAVDFTLAAAPGSTTVSAGQSATYTITVTPLVTILGDTVTFSCSGLPPEGSCAFSPPTLVPGANPANSTLTLSTTGPSAALDHVTGGGPFFFAFTLPLLGLTLAGVGRNRKLRFFGSMLVVLVFLVLPGCRGGGGIKNLGTPPGQYTVTVTAATPSLTHTTQVKLTVQ